VKTILTFLFILFSYLSFAHESDRSKILLKYSQTDNSSIKKLLLAQDILKQENLTGDDLLVVLDIFNQDYDTNFGLSLQSIGITVSHSVYLEEIHTFCYVKNSIIEEINFSTLTNRPQIFNSKVLKLLKKALSNADLTYYSVNEGDIPCYNEEIKRTLESILSDIEGSM